MESNSYSPDKTVASFIHLSTFSKYVFPFGNFIFPLVLWTAKQKDPFVDFHGKQALNFQISVFLYVVFTLGVGIAGIIFLGFEIDLDNPASLPDNFEAFFKAVNFLPLILYIGFIGLVLLGLFFLEIIAVITATIKASEGEFYKYPLTINFITPSPDGHHQSKNEQFNNTQNQTL